MASFTPAVLSKLLKNADNKDFKVTGHHRSALLQVIEILPSLNSNNNNDPRQSKGLFLKVSDSMHSAYVSISDEEDVDLVHSDRIQLGQLVYVTRLDSGSPVPVIRGLKPVPMRRRACVGNPKDLMSSDLLQTRASVCFTKEKKKKVKGAFSTCKTNRMAFDDLKVKNNGKKEGMEMKRLSLDSARRVWDTNIGFIRSSIGTNGARIKSKESSYSQDSARIISIRKAISKNDSSAKHLSLKSPLKSKNEISPQNSSGTLKQDLNKTTEGSIPRNLVKVSLDARSWFDKRISWNSLPRMINDCQKRVICHKNIAFVAAVRALQEASAEESVIHCMHEFAELCQSSQKVAAGPLLQQFMDLYQRMQRAAMVVNSLLDTMTSDTKLSAYCDLQRLSPNMSTTTTGKNAMTWVHDAIDTGLCKFSLLREPENKGSADVERCYYVLIENASKELNSENHSPQNRPSPKNQSNLCESSANRVPSPSMYHLSVANNAEPERKEWSSGSRLKEAASLAEKLLSASGDWFLKYLEDSLNVRFGLSREVSSETACVLGQLRRVNDWLDNLVG